MAKDFGRYVVANTGQNSHKATFHHINFSEGTNKKSNATFPFCYENVTENISLVFNNDETGEDVWIHVNGESLLRLSAAAMALAFKMAFDSVSASEIGSRQTRVRFHSMLRDRNSGAQLCFKVVGHEQSQVRLALDKRSLASLRDMILESDDYSSQNSMSSGTPCSAGMEPSESDKQSPESSILATIPAEGIG
jgi:hypothetical protein